MNNGSSPLRFVLWLATAALLAVAPSLAQAQRAEATEASVKAAFLYKFAGYVEWPPNALPAGAPFTIAVVGSDAVAEELAQIVPGRVVAGHPVVLKRLAEGELPKGVDVLFVGGPNPGRHAAAIAAAQKSAALVVTESPEGLAAGAAINFVSASQHVGFEVSLESAQKSGLHISSRMLAVARRVVQKGA
jgi:uncharacterized protein DUF4154